MTLSCMSGVNFKNTGNYLRLIRTKHAAGSGGIVRRIFGRKVAGTILFSKYGPLSHLIFAIFGVLCPMSLDPIPTFRTQMLGTQYTQTQFCQRANEVSKAGAGLMLLILITLQY